MLSGVRLEYLMEVDDGETKKDPMLDFSNFSQTFQTINESYRPFCTFTAF
ncbi:hypothetical protein T4B_13882 [Trichinella pseudospiralis]|uniref:Uncharacterized protein n=1 Tax=Trichinella pseudospiralis TaxID=6337 RepID=A0A0V1GQK6_TRIPS|nr:hypothetical protein T4B_15366 [Trichinella pseudospiralis]KRZ00483.1 hypothetical protein T4B_13882 [Trichinella pseudospiralis]